MKSMHMTISVPQVIANVTFEGISNITTARLKVDDIPASRVCGGKKYVVFVAIFLERAVEHVNMTKFTHEDEHEHEPVGKFKNW